MKDNIYLWLCYTWKKEKERIIELFKFIIILLIFLSITNYGFIEKEYFPVVIAAIGFCQLIRSKENQKIGEKKSYKELPNAQNRTG